MEARFESYLPTLEEVEWCVQSVLAALYLPGAPRGFDVPRNQAMRVCQALRSQSAPLCNAAKVLARSGLDAESLVLTTPRLLAWSERQIQEQKVLTAACPSYPAGWRAKLAGSAPPALWKRGVLPSTRFVAIVGSRHVVKEEAEFARDVAIEALRLGYGVVSGAAAGCDRAAARGAKLGARQVGIDTAVPLLEVLPYGLNRHEMRPSGCLVSPFAPLEPFSGPQAMQRNALIYAAAEEAIIVHTRFREGGTWRGAIEANRRALCRLICRDDGSPASRALLALGATPLDSPGDLSKALDAVRPQSSLPHLSDL